MRTPRALPAQLGTTFRVRDAIQAGIDVGRLRRDDLDRPFAGIRTRSPLAENTRPRPASEDPADEDPYAKQAREHLSRAQTYAPRLRAGQFLSHDSAVCAWGAPRSLVLHDGAPVDGRGLPVNVSTFGTAPLVRTAGVIAHRARKETTTAVSLDGLFVASPASTWASLGSLPLIDLVALGDYFCRVWREGPGRPYPGPSPLATIDRLRAAIASGRRVGIVRLREAIELVREDSWSPRESAVRCRLVLAGLPEPVLNHDVYDSSGRFLGCVDLAYPARKIAIEYHGVLHHATYARDVERIAALRAAGWTVIEVTAALFNDGDALIRRVRRALRKGS